MGIVPIDLDKALGANAGSAVTSWTEQDVILYHLGIRAVSDITDPGDLRYALEDRLTVLPTFGVIVAQPGARGLTDVPGLEFDHNLMLHGEHEIELSAPIGSSGTVHTESTVAAIHDKGKAAVTEVETVSRAPDGTTLFVNRFTLFMRGAGGFGGDPGPSTGHTTPEREPDVIVHRATVPEQALLYRLSGDRNPVHSDPDVAKRAGFDIPLLHGLCTFGIACRSAVRGVLDDDPTVVRRFRARFAGAVFPGETITTSMWREDGYIAVEASVSDRHATVLTNGRLEIAE
jgi:acyl dehydratase